MRLLLALCTLLACVAATLVPPRHTEGAGSATIALDMDPATPGVQSTATYPSTTTDIYVDVVVQNADAIGAFEFELSIPFGLHYVDFTQGPFLGSTGRPVDVPADTSDSRSAPAHRLRHHGPGAAGSFR